MDRASALRKLQACLRLAKSSEPHEASAALRQAQSLMAEYGLNEADAEASSHAFNEAETRYGQEGMPAHVSLLASIVAKAFGCVIVCSWKRRTWRVGATVMFFGPPASVEVASYAFTVLRRQLERQTQRHTRRIRKRVNKVARGAMFGLGWVRAVAEKLDERVLDIEQRESIERFINQTIGETVKGKGRDVVGDRSYNIADVLAGMRAGRQAELNPGLKGDVPKALEQQS